MLTAGDTKVAMVNMKTGLVESIEFMTSDRAPRGAAAYRATARAWTDNDRGNKLPNQRSGVCGPRVDGGTQADRLLGEPTETRPCRHDSKSLDGRSEGDSHLHASASRWRVWTISAQNRSRPGQKLPDLPRGSASVTERFPRRSSTATWFGRGPHENDVGPQDGRRRSVATRCRADSRCRTSTCALKRTASGATCDGSPS